MREAERPWRRWGPTLLALLSACTTFLAAGNGKTWLPSRSGMEGGLVTVVLVDPLTPTRLFAAAGEAGVFRSVDGAGSWQAAGRPLIDSRAIQFKGFAIDPFQPSTIYAEACSTFFRSDDAGDTWISLSIMREDGGVACTTAIGVDPLTPMSSMWVCSLVATRSFVAWTVVRPFRFSATALEKVSVSRLSQSSPTSQRPSLRFMGSLFFAAGIGGIPGSQ